MTTVTVLLGILILILAALLVAFIYMVRLVKSTGGAAAEKGFDFLQKEIQNLRTSFDSKIGESTRDISDSMKEQLRSSQKVVGDVTEKLTRLEETNRQVVGFSEQLQRLQDALTNTKQRGIVGEYYLETVLQNVLPEGGYKMQHYFENGEAVDAAVYVKDKIVPVDAKFSLENYNRMVEADAESKPAYEKAFVNDLKTVIKQTSKYIRPNEGTTDFAFMFIPSESIYYDLLTNKVGSVGESLIQRAAGEYKVIIVSPTSFLAYLQTVLQGLKAMQIEESAKDIRKRVEELGMHIGKYEDYYKKIGSTLATTVNHYNAGYKELGKIEKDVLRITGSAPGLEVETIEGPEKD